MKHQKHFLISLAVIICLCLSLSSAQTYSMPDAVRRHMATRQMRYHHYMWHQIRDNWNRFSESTRREFRRIGWEPPSPARDSQGNRIQNNLSGEDFLYMHREMIATARRVATQNRASTSFLQSWASVPTPSNRSFPVPPAFTRGSTQNYLAEYKTQARYDTMKRQEDRLKDPARLRRMTLDQLGYEIESGGIHTALHYRWTGASSVGYRGGGSTDNGVPNIDRRWDDVRYDWMGDSYASHVYPLFWRLHGWVDDRIEDWRRANGLSSIRWRGTWIGGPMSNLGSVARKEGGVMQDMDMDDDPEAVGDVVQEAFEIFKRSGVPEFTMEDAERIDSRRKKVRKICKKRSLTKNKNL